MFWKTLNKTGSWLEIYLDLVHLSDVVGKKYSDIKYLVLILSCDITKGGVRHLIERCRLTGYYSIIEKEMGGQKTSKLLYTK